MPRQHPALIAVRTVTTTKPSTADRQSSSRSPLAPVRRIGLPLLGLLLVFSGCFGPYQAPSGGYGSPYGYPAGGVPTQTLQPGGTYTPSPYGQPASPYNTFPQPTPGFPSTIDQTGGSSPFYGSGGSGAATQPYDGGGVPTYSDPNEVQFKQPVPNDSTAVKSWRLIGSELAQVSASSEAGLAGAGLVLDESNFELHATPDASVAATGLTSARTAVGATEVAGHVELPSAEPSTAGHFQFPAFDPASQVEAAPAPMPFPGEASPLPSATTPAPAAPFAHDAEFSWLRGVLRFDAASGVWIMTYSDNPSEEDEHAGNFLVADSPLLEQFKPQAVVLLRGEIDAGQSASAGRAVYRAHVIEPVELSVP
jgi:hypothetical protein